MEECCLPTHDPLVRNPPILESSNGMCNVVLLEQARQHWSDTVSSVTLMRTRRGEISPGKARGSRAMRSVAPTGCEFVTVAFTSYRYAGVDMCGENRSIWRLMVSKSVERSTG